MISLGNIGENQNAGGESNVMVEEYMEISCNVGTMNSLMEFGIAKDDESGFA